MDRTLDKGTAASNPAPSSLTTAGLHQVCQDW
jgi:hypothetical protein